MSQQGKVWGLMGTSALGIVVLAYLGGDVTSAADAAPNAEGAAAVAAKEFVLDCKEGPAKPVTKAGGDPAARDAAQRGLNFLSHATVDWQEKNSCFGCHVQGVTGEAFAVGLSNDYTLPEKGMETVLHGMLDANGGLRTTQGHAAEGGYLRLSSRAFGGAALARYDALVSAQYSDDLLNAAHDLLEYQSEDGDVTGAYNHGVVAQGDIQGTYQAIQTWKQAYERSADDRWLTAIQKAEKSLQRKIDPMLGNKSAPTQHINYAILGLLEAGVGGTEATMVELRDRLVAAQREDGAWGQQLQGSDSNTLITGQTLYTLRRLGLNDGDDSVKRGMAHLMQKQQKDGGWSDSGSEKAEAMWAVLGLVATDVLSVNVDGLVSGQHVEGQHKVSVTAADNEGAGVSKVEVFVDDLRVAGACGSKLDWSWTPKGLETGKHLVDIVATNKGGKESRRRFTVYAGDVYLTGLGSRFENNGTRFTARNIAPKSFGHKVEVGIFETDDNGKATKQVYSLKTDGEQGPIDFHWDGAQTKSKDKAKGGDYVARVTIRDAKGNARQVEEMPFVHADYEYQQKNYAQASGSLNFADDEAAANAEIELVDEKGNVVQRTRSTASGKWRFRNMKADKKYKVRVKKKGFKAKEQDLAPAAGEEAEVDLKFQ